MHPPHRRPVIEALRSQLRDELAAVAQITAMARDEATGSESRSEGKYDTRAIEASYLAAGQGQRLLATRALAAWADGLDTQLAPRVADVGALVLVDLDGREQWLLVAPDGGRAVEVDGVRIRLISVRSPLGSVLRELEVGDGGEVDSPRGIQDVEVLQIR